MSNKDKDLFNAMVNVPKPINNYGDGVRRGYNPIINKIIKILKKREKALTINELQKEIKEIELRGNKDLFKLINKSEKLRFDERTEIFQLKSKYHLNNIEDLKELIRNCDTSIIEDEELLDSYIGIKGDLERLKKENYIKEVKNEEKKVNILFYRDNSDKINSILVDPEYKTAIEELRKIWRDELTYHDNTEENEIFTRKRRLREQAKSKKGDRKRRNKNWANTHIPSLISSNINQ